MRDVFVVTPASYTTQDFLKRARGLGWSPTVAQNVIGLWSGEEYVDFGELPEVAEYYDEEVGKDALAGCGPEPRFFRLRFRDYKVVTKVILNIFPKNPDFVVDNDHGLLTPLSNLDAMRPMDWDWTIAPSRNR